MRLASVRVDRYGPLAGIEHAFDGGLEVVYGPNESGKTLLLDALLRLCEPGVADAVDGVGRVAEHPVGHAVLVHDGEEHVLGAPRAAGDGGATSGSDATGSADVSTLGEVAAVTPRQLGNVFVVRDGDLGLAHEHDFYDATARRLADLHTAELDALRDRIVTDGRITPRDRNLSTADDERAEAGVVRDEAAALADEIRAYVRECREEGVETAERERLALAADVERARGRLARQRAAESLDTHRRLAGHLETVRDATGALAERDCTPEGLERLEAIERELASVGEELDELGAKRADLRARERRLAERRDGLRAELDPLEAREADAEAVRRELDASRDGAVEATDPGGVRLGGAIAGLAALGAGLAAATGDATVGLVLAGLAAAASAWTGWRFRVARSAAREEDAVLRAARDAGLDVETVEDVAPAIRELEHEADRLRAELADVEQEIEVVVRRLDDCEDDRDAHLDRRRELRRERRRRLATAGVPDVDRYRERVERAGALRDDRREAAASLSERLGEPTDRGDPEADPTFETRIEHWASELAAVREGVDHADASADDHDPDALDDLDAEVDRLEAALADRRERLAEHRDRIDAFADDLAAIPTGRFREEPIRLSARSVRGLAATAADLESLVDDVERDADVARAALSVLADVRAAEEAKLAELFGPESRASEIFRSITGGRYAGVTYDPEARTLVVREGSDGSAVTADGATGSVDGAAGAADGAAGTVDGAAERADRWTETADRSTDATGAERPAAELSRGATDQLYLAARVGLAERLCPGEPGFLLLDDALLPADPERLAAGFDALRALADRGWQIVYWTAKPEVGEALVAEHDLPCRTFERL